jgi:hypothetical protein
MSDVRGVYVICIKIIDTIIMTNYTYHIPHTTYDAYIFDTYDTQGGAGVRRHQLLQRQRSGQHGMSRCITIIDTIIHHILTNYIYI